MRRRHDFLLWTLAALWVALLVASCGGEGGGLVPAAAPPEGRAQARLDRFAGCDEVEAALRADAAFKVGAQAEALRTSGRGARERIPPIVVPDPVEADVGEAPPEDFTETNVQVAGVDEADFIETDGERIYLLHGRRFVVLDAWPPQTAALEADVEIEGIPGAMFVDGTRAVIFSSVYDDGGGLAAADPCASIHTPEALPVGGGDGALCPAEFTKVSVLDLVGEPSVVRELYLEGRYAGARRHDAIVRVIVRGGLALPAEVPSFWSQLPGGPSPESGEDFLARVDAWERAALGAIERSTAEHWLPTQWERDAGGVREIPPLCSAVYVPPAGASEHGMTRILALDMREDGGAIHDALILGDASEVYASRQRLVLAHREWAAGPEGNRTALHLFSVGAGGLESDYLGSGYVPGVPLNQFSFDMQGDVLRVATTQSGPFGQGEGTFTTRSQILTTRLSGDVLEQVGTTGGLAPGERIYSARFLGDRGYLVTFRQVDPLFVVDLSDPANPTVLGELKLPGFSEYMHPLGEDHLLTIGQEADLQGRVTGLALRIFDVSDDTAPVLDHLHVFSGQGGSPAVSDHLSFTFDAARGLLTFPYVSYGEPYRSALELFSVDADTGFEFLGEVDHAAVVTETCGLPVHEQWQCGYPAGIRRGLFIEDSLYSVSGAAVLVHDSVALEAPVATVVLPDSGLAPFFFPRQAAFRPD